MTVLRAVESGSAAPRHDRPLRPEMLSVKKVHYQMNILITDGNILLAVSGLY